MRISNWRFLARGCFWYRVLIFNYHKWSTIKKRPSLCYQVIFQLHTCRNKCLMLVNHLQYELTSQDLWIFPVLVNLLVSRVFFMCAWMDWIVIGHASVRLIRAGPPTARLNPGTPTSGFCHTNVGCAWPGFQK